MLKRKFRIDDYGDLLAEGVGKKLISITYFGSYQGDWIAALDNGKNIEVWKGFYGSCSVCDSLQSMYRMDKNADDYLTRGDIDALTDMLKEEGNPFIKIPKNIFNDISVKDFEALLPLNTRADIYNFDAGELLTDIRQALQN
ncbi:MAG TPA: hypothetical protein PKU78_03380 [Candidatus Dojkabacteria bacterium]|nr:hypothetical protein [Candidatus Dojkabacteria bacterium]HRO65237.1 hypothetical protein [Candidatus Dojkabacteria bacterium]HRP36533.1 hypothetical protein [Candidatus Dojkabacteria bacterium]HRP50797.1 hypothetical protein [Candidatus Dojkabacteria bacterium]